MRFPPRTLLALSCALALPFFASANTFDQAFHKLAAPTIDVFFSPNGGCAEAVIRELNNSKRTILVQAYSFTSAPIAQALVEAHRRGVDVKVILDKSQQTERYSAADFTAHAGIPTWIDAAHA